VKVRGVRGPRQAHGRVEQSNRSSSHQIFLIGRESATRRSQLPTDQNRWAAGGKGHEHDGYAGLLGEMSWKSGCVVVPWSCQDNRRRTGLPFSSCDQWLDRHEAGAKRCFVPFYIRKAGTQDGDWVGRWQWIVNGGAMPPVVVMPVGVGSNFLG